MAFLSFSPASPIDIGTLRHSLKGLARALLAGLRAAIRPRVRTPEDILAADARREAHRRAVDRLLP
jgi:hypothetical protein